MAETYSPLYTDLYVTKPAAKARHVGVELRVIDCRLYTQVLAGAAADTLKLARLRPGSKLLTAMSQFAFAGFTASMTLSIGWGSYTDYDGVVQAASATGLINAATISNGTGIMSGGMLSTATPNDFNPAVFVKDFRNRTGVDIYATFNDQVPGANATLHALLVYVAEG